MKNYYEILAIDKNSTKEDLKRAYYLLAHQYHPDKNNGNEARFKEINEAYRILSNKKTKDEYDYEFFKNNSEVKKEKSESNPKPNPVSNVKKDNDKLTLSNFFIGFAFLMIFFSGMISGPQSKSVDISNDKCIKEYGIRICNLKLSSLYVLTTNFRHIETDGNDVICLNMKTGRYLHNPLGKIQISNEPSFCVSDYGYVYVDPTIRINKYYGNIYRDGYNLPYKTKNNYDTCLWTYEDGNAAVPYVELLSSVGPQTGFNVAAFCKNGEDQIDIYTHKDKNKL